MTRKTLQCFLALAVVPALCSPQAEPRAPLSLADILGRLAAGSTPSYVAHLVKTRGISFSPREHELSLVRLAGGRGILLERISAVPVDNSSASSSTTTFDLQLARCAELVQVGAITEAERECRGASTENLASPWPLIAITRCVEDDSPRKDAVALLRRAVELAPNLAEPHLALSRVVTSVERRKELNEAERLDPENLDVIQKGIIWAANPSDNPIMRRLAAIEVDFAASHSAAAAYYAFQGKKELMIEEMRAAIRLEPDNPAMHHAFSIMYSNINIQDDAGEIAELAETVRASPRSLYWHDKQAFTLWAEDKSEPAIAAFRDMLKLFPDNSPASFRLVELLVNKGDRDAAIAELRRYIDATSAAERDTVQAAWRLLSLKQLGDLLFQERDFESAGATYEAVLAQKPDALTINALGRVRLAQGRLEDASKEFRRAIREDATAADPHYNLALCLARQNNLDEAIAENRRALEIDPEYSDARFAISDVLIQKDDTQGAIHELELVLQSNPKSAAAVNNLAWVYATCKDKQKRDPEAALRLATHAVELLEQTPGAPPEQRAAFLDTLAEALLINGQVNEAFRTEKSAAGLDPNNRALLERLELFRKAAQSERRPSVP